MSDPSTTPPQSIRMFVGYRNPSLDVQRYRQELGQTFMPGTPYMLQPLGLQAYLAAAIDESGDAAAPHEVALICYPSQAVYQRARSHTLRGRVYTQIHGGVYDMARSGGAWPALFDPAAPAPNGAVHLLPHRVDWQAGSTSVLIGVPDGAAGTGQAFRDRCRDVLASANDVIGGCDQVLAVLRDSCLVVWIHGSDATPRLADIEQHLATRVRVVARQTCERVICIDDPPAVTITGSVAFNFVFVRGSNAALS